MSDKRELFEKNRNDIEHMFLRENQRRANNQLPELTLDEKNIAVDGMIQMLMKGKPVTSYHFKSNASPPLPNTHNIPKKVAVAAANSYAFEISICNNGFLANAARNGVVEAYIFKTEEELLEIFRETIFSELKKIKERKSNEENNKIVEKTLTQPMEKNIAPIKNSQTNSKKEIKNENKHHNHPL